MARRLHIVWRQFFKRKVLTIQYTENGINEKVRAINQYYICTFILEATGKYDNYRSYY